MFTDDLSCLVTKRWVTATNGNILSSVSELVQSTCHAHHAIRFGFHRETAGDLRILFNLGDSFKRALNKPDAEWLAIRCEAWGGRLT